MHRHVARGYRHPFSVQVANERAYGVVIERVVHAGREPRKEIADHGPLVVIYVNLRDVPPQSFHLRNDFFDGDAVGIAAWDEPGPVAADLLHELRVFESAENP